MKIKLEKINGQPFLIINDKKFNMSIGSSIYRALNELRLLKTELEIKFVNYTQFTELINQINKSAHN